MAKTETAMMKLIDKWERMPAHIFQEWMKKNHLLLLIVEEQQIKDAYLEGQNHADKRTATNHIASKNNKQ